VAQSPRKLSNSRQQIKEALAASLGVFKVVELEPKELVELAGLVVSSVNWATEHSTPRRGWWSPALWNALWPVNGSETSPDL